MGKSESALRFKAIARPKHTEEISGDEAAIHSTWEIMMMIKPKEIDEFCYPTYYYMRAGNGQQAAMMAHQLWSRWEKVDKGLEFHRYPDVEEMGAGRGIEEAEFQEKWKEAQRYEHQYVGMRENPSAFTFRKPGYGVESESKSQIIVPGHPLFNSKH